MTADLPPVAPHRVGQPAPLPFHIGAAVAAYQQAILAAPNAAEPSFPWHPDLPRYTGAPPDLLALTHEAASRLSAMMRGVELWQRHPWRRSLTPPPVIWRSGTSQLFDYGQTPEATDPAGPVVLVVPSLINRAYILDLMPGRSFLRGLAAAGLRPLLLDWGAPGMMEARFDIEDYMTRRLMPALAAASVLGGGAPPAVLGYCMGGTVAAGLALTTPEIRGLVTIGAPWDFAAARGTAQGARAAAAQGGGAAQVRAILRTLSDAFGAVPVSVFQHLFAVVDPMQAARKFRRFAETPQDSAEAEFFVAMEDWLADGVPMAGPAAETLLVDWHLENTTARGQWPQGRYGRDRPPSLIVAGRRDTIAPPAVAGGLRRVLPDAELLSPPLGHVGMITGAAAPDAVWGPVAAFLRDLP
ncbi:alpha/beta fold hydrolase [Oceanibium sediminis]|uniref:alpha/beta fold hydrolase n=1 Tax=Oceanibium sediminis TaxID=2026339 RepID=UPI0018E53C88|nr:alpha/beta fold hydrolase [Oceanibium sediminis]